MSPTRRDFVQSTTAAGAALSLGIVGPAFAEDREIPKTAKRLRILILGGTGFIGPHMVRYALKRGHTVTLFNRGRTNTHLFPEVAKLVGDRDGNLEALKGREWDAVIDNSGYAPRNVRDSAQLLKNAVRQYLFTSTRAVYAGFNQANMHENAPLGMLEVPKAEWEGYGPLKVLCEEEVEKAFPGRATVARPPLIVGPGDRSDRFTYWVARIDRGGEVMAPGDPTHPVQFIDVRDLAGFYIRMLEHGDVGTYNVEGPEAPLSMAEMLYGIRAVTNAVISFTWVDTDFLLKNDVEPFRDMPAWRPPRGYYENYQRMNISRALEKGFTFRPLAETAKDTLEWHKSRPYEQQSSLRAGISSEREVEVLAAWDGWTGRS